MLINGEVRLSEASLTLDKLALHRHIMPYRNQDAFRTEYLTFNLGLKA